MAALSEDRLGERLRARPDRAAQAMMRDGDHSACSRCAFGMCSSIVVCRPRW
jgi:hypothetical protein